jgi:uncharacterized protein YyaL (SSP411 family)
MANRLATESSPYLRQHQDNPVDWWPWGDAAFAEAKRTGKPVFLSIGYAACHWCHVMAHESFEDAATAKLMNERYVNIKVDREELPDVDAIYMNAIQVMGEGGGWPLSAWCTSDGKPYFLGTYFPPEPKFGRPSFKQVLISLADAWANQQEQVQENVTALVEGLRHVDEHYRKGAARGEVGGLGAQLVIAAGRTVAQRCDPRRGGLGGAPKFPNSSVHELLGRAARLPFGDPARDAFVLWTRGMVRGGIYDHLGGGWARYAVDDRWLVPHFEKMLYDQAQILGVVADTIAILRAHPVDGFTTAELDERVAESVAFLARELSDPAGGLWSSLDADSEGEEGKFYVWSPAEIRAALGSIDALHVIKAYGVTDAGNFEHTGKSVLERVTPIGPASDEDHLRELRAKLFAARAARVRPGTDDKVLTGWNALAITGLLRAWRATGHEPARALALRVAEFLVAKVVTGDRVARVFHGGEPAAGSPPSSSGGSAAPRRGTTKLDGTLDDYAFTAAAFLDLAEATGDAAWWRRGAELLAAVRARFTGETDGVVVFYLAAADDGALLVHRPESHHDGAIPSGAAVAVEGLLRLGLVGGDAGALALGERYLAQRLAGASVTPLAASRLYVALDLYLHHAIVVVTEGDGRDALIAAVHRAHAPAALVAGPWASADLLAGKAAAGGRAQAYVCRGQTCSPPVTDPAALAALLAPPQ